MYDQSLTAYIMAAAFSLGFLMLAALSSSLIKFEGGNNPGDKQKRKVWFWVLGVLTPVLIFLVGFFFIRNGIKVPSKQANFTMHLGIATGIGFAVYILLGFILSRIFRRGKIGQWF